MSRERMTPEEIVAELKRKHPQPKTVEFNPEEPPQPPWFLRLSKIKLPWGSTFVAHLSEELDKKDD